MNSRLHPIFQRALAPFAPARFTVIERAGQFYVHDAEDGSDTTAMRAASARHLAQQWNAQAAQEASNEGELDARDLREIDAQFAPKHAITRESSGTGLGDWTRVKCSCGFVGPQRYGYSNIQWTDLLADERAHRRT